MHLIKNISERNKIYTQSGADAYIRRNWLISKSDSWNWKNPKNSLFWANILKKPKNPKKTKPPKKPNKPQKTHWTVFF